LSGRRQVAELRAVQGRDMLARHLEVGVGAKEGVMSEQQTVCRSCGSEIYPSAKFCPECGAAMHGPMSGDTQEMSGPPPRMSVPTDAAHAAKNGAKEPSGFRVRVAVGAALVLAVAGFALGLIGFLQARSAHSQTAQLRQQLHGTEATISSLQANSQSGTVTALKGQVGGMQGQLSKLTVCVPELQQEIYGLNVSTTFQSVGGTDYLTGANLANPTIVSGNCTKVLSNNGP
jgi:hypothetical protein